MNRGIAAIARTAVIGALIGASLVASGCLPLAATGIVIGGLSATDRRTLGAQTEDTSIEVKAVNRLQEQLGGSGGISVTSYNRMVLLTGQTLDEATKVRAAEIVAKIDNVRQPVHNELAVSGRASLGTSASDMAVTTKVKASFVEAKDVQANAVKVVTESAVVYLMGIVTRAEAERMAQIAARVSGVKRVVTLFEYVTADELARIERVNRDAQTSQ